MDRTTDAPDGAKARRRPRAKGQENDAAERCNLNIRLGADALERLAIHAAKAHKSKSAMVEELITTHLRRWVVQDRSRDRPEEVSAV